MKPLDQIAIYAEQVEQLALLIMDHNQQDARTVTLANVISEKAQAIQAAASKAIK